MRLTACSALCLLPFLAFAQTLRFSGQTFTAPIPFQANLDSLIIENCTFSNFSGEAVRFENIDYVEVRNAQFHNLTNLNSTRAIICGKKSAHVVLKNLAFNNIRGTAIRFPTDGESSPEKRMGKVYIEQVAIHTTLDPGAMEANGIRIFLTDSLWINHCQLTRIQDNAINLGRNSSGQTQFNQRINYFDIHHNTIDSVLGNGILSAENCGTGRVHHNLITHVAYDGIGMLPAEGDHGIYWQTPGALLFSNTVLHVADGLVAGNTGNGISLRTNARVFQNEVGFCTRNGISYWNDHPGNSLLQGSDNLIYGTGLGGIYINGSGTNPNKPDSLFVFNNTVHNIYTSGIQHQFAPVAVNEMDSYNYLAANLLIFENVTDTNAYIAFLGSVPSKTKVANTFGNPQADFIDVPARNYHLKETSTAIGKVSAAIAQSLCLLHRQSQPMWWNSSLRPVLNRYDLDGTPRTLPDDAGCYAYPRPIQPESFQPPAPPCYPNPFTDQLTIYCPEENVHLRIINNQGIVLWEKRLAGRGRQTINPPPLTPGWYVLHLSTPGYSQSIRVLKAKS
jgi:hypothetical protein